jgi:hypothetical protein
MKTLVSFLVGLLVTWAIIFVPTLKMLVWLVQN